MVDLTVINEMAVALQSAMEGVVGSEISSMQFDAEKIQIAGDVTAGWKKASADIEKIANDARETTLSMPAEIAKQVDKIFGDALPPMATDAIKGLVMPQVQAATQKLLGVVDGLDVQDVLYGKGLDMLSQAQTELSAALAQTASTGGASKLTDIQQQVADLFTKDPTAAFAPLGLMKNELADVVQEINKTSATVLGGFTKALEVFDSLGVAGKLEIDTSDLPGLLGNMTGKLEELEKVVILSQFDLKNKGVLAPSNAAKYQELLDQITSTVDMPSSLNTIRRAGQLKDVAGLGIPFKELTKKFDSLKTDITGLPGEINKLDTLVPGNAVLQQSAEQFRKFKDVLPDLRSSVAGITQLLPSVNNTVSASSIAKGLGLAGSVVNTSGGTQIPGQVKSDFVQQKNLFKALEPAASSTFTSIKSNMQAGNFIKDNLAKKNPADSIKPTSPDFFPAGNAAQTQMDTLLNTSSMRADIGKLQDSLKGYDTKVGRFQGGGLAGSIVRGEIQGVIGDAQEVLTTSSEFLEELDAVAAPISKEFNDLRKEAKQLGDETLKSLTDRGKFDSLLKSSWDTLRTSNDLKKSFKDIETEAKKTYRGDITKIEATLATLEQRIDRTRKAAKHIETEFDSRVKRVNGIIEQRTLRMKQMKAAYDTANAMLGALKF